MLFREPRETSPPVGTINMSQPSTSGVEPYDRFSVGLLFLSIVSVKKIRTTSIQ